MFGRCWDYRTMAADGFPFWQLSNEFVEALSILACVDRVTTLNFTLARYGMFHGLPFSASYLTSPFLCPRGNDAVAAVEASVGDA